ncbi:hypothetical protein SKAU_G00418640 [Synaphobranchus kaupii]|uniref:Uncharacterized protein n=1 Tax=Synaphobranchus kaupii TaxID=118154 RepID=A0A9Q1I919_SYNKA|nr:hypothetical protein SKAU_G00418640 [Synaphobranchus kaupii]
MASGGPLKPGSAGVDDKRSEPATGRPCPASCGASISSRDQHPLCIACMGVSHAQESLANPESCVHCIKMPLALRLTSSPAGAGETWFPLDSPLPDNLLEHYEDEEGEGEGTEDDASAEALGDEVDDDEEEDAILIQPSRPSSALSGGTPPSVKEADIHEVCKRAAAKLGLEWPASQTSEGEERDLYDGKWLPSRQPPGRQLLPAVPACMKEIRKYWDKPFRSRVPVKGYSSLEIHGGSDLGVGDPPLVEPAVAYHLHPNRRATLSSAGPSLPGKMERFTASMGVPDPAVWEEICVVADLILRVSRGAVQGVGRVMGLAVAGERALWLNLSSLPDQDKQVIMDSPFDPFKVKGLFGEAVNSMQQACDLRKKQGEAFNLCLPRKPTPRQQPPPRSGFAAAAAKNRTAAAKEPRGPNVEQAVSQQPRAPNQKPWGKHSFAAVAAVRQETGLQFIRPPQEGDSAPGVSLSKQRPTPVSKRGRLVYDPSSPILAWQALDPRNSPAPLRGTVAPPPTEGSTDTGAGADFPPATPAACALGLARERMNLHAVGLPLRVINTIQSARATSTRTLYDLKWRVFEKWCEEKHVVSFQCSVAEVLCFLQEMLDKGRAFSTIKETDVVVLELPWSERLRAPPIVRYLTLFSENRVYIRNPTIS